MALKAREAALDGELNEIKVSLRDQLAVLTGLGLPNPEYSKFNIVRQGLSLVHSAAQLDSILSLGSRNSPHASHRKCSRYTEIWTSVSPTPLVHLSSQSGSISSIASRNASHKHCLR